MEPLVCIQPVVRTKARILYLQSSNFGVQALEDLAEFWENKLLEKASLLDNAHEEKREQSKEFTEIRRQVEDDADRELLGMKNKFVF